MADESNNGKRSIMLTPHMIVSVLHLTVVTAGIGGVFYKMQADIEVQKDQIIELRKLVDNTQTNQRALEVKLARVATTLDLMLPAIQRLDEAARARFFSRPRSEAGALP